ncbi:MAG: tol-pal system protein YbgF [Gammaproteobacteria bacterium]|nr:tol-pal system protein YbgF [Gammaproteobacteria bacterium]
MHPNSRWNVKGIALCMSLGLYTPLSLAEVPVVDESVQMESDGAVRSSSEAVASESGSEYSLDSRVSRLEKQLSSRSQVDALSQIEELRREVADLRGQIDVMNHQAQQSIAPKQEVAPPSVTEKAAPVVAAPTSAPAATPPAAADPKELEMYQKGYEAIKAKDFDEAKEAFQAYLDQYKRGNFSGNAHYWLGEIYLHQNAYAKSAAEFNQVTANPKNAKYPEAMLKLGFLYYQQSNWDQARKQLELVRQKFPGTTVSTLAGGRLQEMTQQGH